MQIPRTKKVQLITAVIVILTAVFLAFLPSLDYSFLFEWDDAMFIHSNPKMYLTFSNAWYYFINPKQDLYTPLPMWSFMIDRFFFDLNPFGWRIHNLLLHCAAAFFLFLIIRRFQVNFTMSLIAVLLWAVSPQRVESVVWIVERKDLLCGLFAFAAMYFFMTSVSKGKMPWLAGILSVLAIFSKPAAAPLAGVMIVYIFCLKWKKYSLLDFLRTLVVPVGAVLCAVFWSMSVTMKTNPGVLKWNFPVLFHNLIWYPVTALIPYEVNPIYPQIGRFEEYKMLIFWGTAFLAAIVIFARFVCRMEWGKIIAFMYVIGGCMVPVLGLFDYTSFHYCDRYNYLVSAAVWCFAAVILKNFHIHFSKWGKRIQILLGIGVLLLIYLLRLYLPYWADCQSLFLYSLDSGGIINLKTLECLTGCAHSYDNAAIMKRCSDYLAKNKQHYDPRKTENTLRYLRSWEALFAGNTGLFKSEFAHLMESDTDYLYSLENPLFYTAARYCFLCGNTDDAKEYFNRIPENLYVKGNTVFGARCLALKYELEGRRDKAAEIWEKLSESFPGNPVYQRELQLIGKK